MRIALVFGKKLLSDGELGEEYQAQILKAVNDLWNNVVDRAVVMGGVTRAAFPSEAEAALRYIPKALHPRVVLETDSKSTSENIQNAKLKLVAFDIDEALVHTSKAHEVCVKRLLKQYWPEVADKAQYDGVPSGWRSWIVHSIIYFCLLLDPNDKFFLPLQKWSGYKG